MEIQPIIENYLNEYKQNIKELKEKVNSLESKVKMLESNLQILSKTKNEGIKPSKTKAGTTCASLEKNFFSMSTSSQSVLVFLTNLLTKPNNNLFVTKSDKKHRKVNTNSIIINLK